MGGPALNFRGSVMIFPPEAVRKLRARLLSDIQADNVTRERAYQRLLESDPYDYISLQGLAELRLDAGDIEAARQYHWRAIEANPCYWSNYMALVGIEQKEGHSALSQGLAELAFRKLKLDVEALKPVEPKLDWLEGIGSEYRDLEPPEVTARLRPHRLITQLQEVDEPDKETIDSLVREGEEIIPLLAGVLRGYAQSAVLKDRPRVVENALALMGEIGSPAALPHILEFIPLDNPDLSGQPAGPSTGSLNCSRTGRRGRLRNWLRSWKRSGGLPLPKPSSAGRNGKLRTCCWNG